MAFLHHTWAMVIICLMELPLEKLHHIATMSICQLCQMGCQEILLCIMVLHYGTVFPHNQKQSVPCWSLNLASNIFSWALNADFINSIGFLIIVFCLISPKSPFFIFQSVGLKLRHWIPGQSNMINQALWKSFYPWDPYVMHTSSNNAWFWPWPYLSGLIVKFRWNKYHGLKGNGSCHSLKWMLGLGPSHEPLS